MYPVVERVNLTYSGQDACRGVPACRAITGNRGLLKAIVDKMTGGIELQNSPGLKIIRDVLGNRGRVSVVVTNFKFLQEA